MVFFSSRGLAICHALLGSHQPGGMSGDVKGGRQEAVGRERNAVERLHPFTTQRRPVRLVALSVPTSVTCRRFPGIGPNPLLSIRAVKFPPEEQSLWYDREVAESGKWHDRHEFPKGFHMIPYSSFLQTLHDEREPVGTIGRGTHYSVLRSVVWHDAKGKLLDTAAFHDFAVIWDEDHDTRIIDVCLALHVNGLLTPALFVGERKGNLTIVLDHKTRLGYGATAFSTYVEEVTSVANDLDDPWQVFIESMSNDRLNIIGDADDRIRLYLQNISMLWQLGVKPAIPPTRR
jgi:hypothetical protein